MKQAIATIVFTIFSFINSSAQYTEVPADSLQVSLWAYGSFRGHFAFYNNEVEFQENDSRIGFELSVMKKTLKFFVASELLSLDWNTGRLIQRTSMLNKDFPMARPRLELTSLMCLPSVSGSILKKRLQKQ